MSDTRVSPIEATKTLPKRCGKCGGKLFIDRDYAGYYMDCPTCGLQINISNAVERKIEPVLKRQVK